MPLILFEIGFLERLSHSPLWGRVYSIFIRLIKFFSLINGRMCSQRNCPVCSLKPIICLSSGRLLASNRLLGIAVYIIVWTATWQRGTRKICLWGASHVSVRILQISHVERTGELICPHYLSIVVGLWRSAVHGKGDQAEMVDCSYILPVELIFSKKLWRVLISLFSPLCDPAVWTACYLGNVYRTYWWLEMSSVWSITPFTDTLASVNVLQLNLS